MADMLLNVSDICFDTNLSKIFGRHIFAMSRGRHRNQDGGILVKIFRSCFSQGGLELTKGICYEQINMN